jgi:hypothetical protein
MTRRILFVLVALLLAFSPTLAPADGGKAKNVLYDGQARPQTGNGNWTFNIDTSPIIFYLGTVNNKYHVVLIRVKNNTDAPLSLAKDQDSIELRFSDGQKVKGLLNLPATDRTTWDGLEAEIRTAVVYPQFVDPHEEEGVYCYVPIGDVKGPRKKHEMPSSIIYSIKSLPSPIELRRRGVAAA